MLDATGGNYQCVTKQASSINIRGINVESWQENKNIITQEKATICQNAHCTLPRPYQWVTVHCACFTGRNGGYGITSCQATRVSKPPTGMSVVEESRKNSGFKK